MSSSESKEIHRNECLVFFVLKYQAENVHCSCIELTHEIQWRIWLEKLCSLIQEKESLIPRTMHEWLPGVFDHHYLASQNTWPTEQSSKGQSVSLLTVFWAVMNSPQCLWIWQEDLAQNWSLNHTFESRV
jgi:hypothetical protein